MALVTCPECNNQISDLATVCPMCGFPMTHNVEDNAATMTHNAEVDSSTAVACSEPSKRKKKVWLFAGISAIVCIALVAFAVITHFQNIQNRKEYIENLQLYINEALSGAAEAEKVCNLTQQVWYDTIYEKYNAETIEYTQTNGKFHEDFNKSINILYSSDKITSLVSSIQESQDSIDALYKLLRNPGDEFIDCFSEVEALYTAYRKLTNHAITPSGSLSTYSDNLHSYDDEFITHYEKLKLLIPNT